MSQTSSGLEPVFRNVYTRRRKISHNDTETQVDFVDTVGDKWQEYRVFHHNVRDYLKHTKKKENAKLPRFFVESDQINWMRRVKIQETIQKHIDHAISSTINLPAGTKPEVVGQLYKEGWKRGLKGITVYVDGSRTGVLVTAKEDEGTFAQHDAAKRPELVRCEIHRTTIKGEKWVVLVGLVEGKPYELFAGLSSKLTLPKKYNYGTILKHPRKTIRSIYDLVLGETEDDEMVVNDIINIFDNPNNAIITRMISLSLRHGANVKFVVEQMQKDQDTDFTSFNKVLSRVLKKYISDGETAQDKVCPSCAAVGLIYQDGCITCTQCGYAKCG